MEPWVGECFTEWDTNALLTDLGATVAPIDPAAMPAPMRDVLGDWMIQRSEQLAERESKRAEASKG